MLLNVIVLSLFKHLVAFKSSTDKMEIKCTATEVLVVIKSNGFFYRSQCSNPDTGIIRVGSCGEQGNRILILSPAKCADHRLLTHGHRNAQKKEIIKAYRKLAQQWHPDNFQNAEEKKKAEKRFIDIVQAKEVLTDPGNEESSLLFTNM